MMEHSQSTAARRQRDKSDFGIAALCQFLRHTLDKVLAAALLLILLPVLLGAATAVRLSSPGPALYRQARVGLHGKVFQMLKFRSMEHDFEHGTPVWGNNDAKPITALGHLLRRSGIDELPQLLNVLRGDMSLVGPRPERPEFVAEFARTMPGYSRRHSVKGGITGLSQIHGLRGDTDLVERLSLDLRYIEGDSLLQDLRILTLTALQLLRLRWAGPSENPMLFVTGAHRGPEQNHTGATLPAELPITQRGGDDTAISAG